MTRSQHAQHDERRARALTDEDVSAVVEELETRIAARFYGNLGRGLWGLAWRAIVSLLIGISAYGALRGIK